MIVGPEMGLRPVPTGKGLCLRMSVLICHFGHVVPTSAPKMSSPKHKRAGAYIKLRASI